MTHEQKSIAKRRKKANQEEEEEEALIVTSAAKLSKFMHYSFKEPSNSENEKWCI